MGQGKRGRLTRSCDGLDMVRQAENKSFLSHLVSLGRKQRTSLHERRKKVAKNVVGKGATQEAAGLQRINSPCSFQNFMPKFSFSCHLLELEAILFDLLFFFTHFPLLSMLT